MRSILFSAATACVLLAAGCAQPPTNLEAPETTATILLPAAAADEQTTVPDNIPEKEVVISPPLSRAWERVTKKSLGTRVSPTNSPVSPKRFSGFHTGTDFETFPEEQDADVTVMAVCTGPLLRVATADGYGGYAVQSCIINDQPVTVVYGHLRRSSVISKVGDTVSAGQAFAMLGKGFSTETDGERKHLHLSIAKGRSINIRGYVSSASALEGWLDLEKLGGVDEIR